MTYKHRVKCIEAHTVVTEASQLVDQHGNVLCEAPASSFAYLYGHESGFRTKADRTAFLKANPGKWEAL